MGGALSSAPAWCSRCGWDLGRDLDLPCGLCWEATATPAMVRFLAERAAENAPRAFMLLANIEDTDAAVVLRDAAAHGGATIRAAALSSLGWSGAAEDVPLIAAALKDAERSVRKAARGALAELGGQKAADALLSTLDETVEDELEEVVQALAWLRDARALGCARRLAEDALGRSRFVGWRNPAWAMVRLGDAEDRRALVWKMIDLARQVEGSDPQRSSAELRRAKDAYGNVRNALELEYAGEVGELSDALYGTLPEQADWIIGRKRSNALSIVELEPREPRRVPRLTLAELGERPFDNRSPSTKFGGQPDWIDEPTWPLAADGRPLVFFAQLPIMGQPARTAYVFVSADERAATFEPLSDGNAVVVQPGGAPHLPTAPMVQGPALFAGAGNGGRFRRINQSRRYERYIRLEDSADPPTWTWPDPPEGTQARDRHGDWNKIGGTPCFLQEEQCPPGDGWCFAFQFSADWAGRELGDGAECYGFVRDDGTGAFLWQCH